MADKIIFSMSDKQLLTKLHLAAMRNAKSLKASTYMKLANSGLADGPSVDPDKKDIDAIAQKDGSKIKFFSSKNGLYEVGIAVDADGIKHYIDKSFSTSETTDELEPVKLYSTYISGKHQKEADKLKDIAYSCLVEYMTAFCGEKYASSIPKDKVICEAYDNEKSAFVVKDGMLGRSDINYNSIGVLLYKIGYSVGAKK